MIFILASKVIRICFGFALLPSLIGLKHSCYFLNQSEVKPKPIMARLCTLDAPFLFALSFDWFPKWSMSFVIGQSDYFGFGFTTID